MQLRCPGLNCLIDVPEALVGTRIRCPHCGALMMVEMKCGDTPAEQMQTGLPPQSFDASKARDPNAPSNLENQIYDGLPPLSVMLALRQRRGHAYDADDFAERYPMTEDDWKALAAFEQVLRAVGVLTTLIWIGGVALAMNALTWIGMFRNHRASMNEAVAGEQLVIVATGLAMAAGLAYSVAGKARLRQIGGGELLDLLPWCLTALTLVFGATAVRIGARLFDGQSRDSLGEAALLVVACNIVACVASGHAAVLAWFAVRSVRPPEIAHRLTDALKYLA